MIIKVGVETTKIVNVFKIMTFFHIWKRTKETDKLIKVF